MSGYLIALIVLFVITGVFIILFIANMIFIWSFSLMLKRHTKALTILLVQKYEAFESLFAIYEKNGIEVDDEVKELFNSIDIKNFEVMDNEESIKDRNTLSLLKQELVGAVKRNEEFQKNEEFQINVKMLNSIDNQFRQVAAAYNADVIGYNYWVRFKIFRYLFLYNHVGLKDIIS